MEQIIKTLHIREPDEQTKKTISDNLDIINNLLYNKIIDAQLVSKINDPNLHNIIGICHKHSGDDDGAVKYWLLSVENNNANAIHNLCGYYYYDKKDYCNLKKYCKMGIKLKIAHCATMLGLHYREVKNINKMKKYFEIGVELESEQDCSFLGNYYEDVEKNYEMAIKYYNISINLGHASGAFNMGLLYYKQKNYDSMKKYYEMAINMGDFRSLATASLGDYYNYIEKNYDLMKKYYDIALSKDPILVASNYGLYYLTIEINFELAEKYFKIGVSVNDDQSMFQLGSCYISRGINYELAVNYLKMACELKNGKAALNLGYYYRVIDKNFPLAKKYYVMALEYNDGNAVYELNNLAISENNFDDIENHLSTHFKKFKHFVPNKFRNDEVIILSCYIYCTNNVNDEKLYYDFITKVRPTLSKELLKKYRSKIFTIVKHFSYLLEKQLETNIKFPENYSDTSVITKN